MSRPLHIGILSQPANPHCRKWATGLARAGVQVTVFTLDPKIDIAGVEVVSLGGGKSYGYRDYWRTRTTLRRVVHQREVTLLHPLHLTPFGSWALWADTGLPVVAAAMGADVLDYPPRPLDAPFWQGRHWESTGSTSSMRKLQGLVRWAWYRGHVRQVVRKSLWLTADNDVLRQALIKWFGAEAKKVQLLRWGVDADGATQNPAIQQALLKQIGLAEGKPFLLSPRGLKPIYQPDYIRQLAANYYRAGGTWPIVILKGPYAVPEAELAAHRALQNLYPKFRLVETTLSPTEVQQLMWSATAVLNAPAYDGYSAALAEARFAGCIPVANRIAAHAELFSAQMPALWLEAEPDPKPLLQLEAMDTATRQAMATRHQNWIARHSTLEGAVTRFLNRLEAKGFARR